MKYMPLIVLLLLACGGAQQEKTEKPEMKTEAGTYMHIAVKEYGEIVIRMYEKEAPNNVANIVKLAEQGFYDGLTFHRIIKGFVIQGGCPVGNGTGDPGYRIDDEISKDLSHLKGTVAMANSGPNTNGCQFYICLEPLPRLDGGYTIIGQVAKNMEVVERIGAVPTSGPPRDQPLTPVIMERVWIEKM